MTTRILPLASIPAALWKDGLFHLPNELTQAYRLCLEEAGLLAEALKGSKKKDIHGGSTPDETREHFAHRYAVSAARPEAVALDPTGLLADIPDAILSTFSQGHVALLDVPCGAGTTAASILSTMATLRESGALPRLPVTVFVTGGDASDTALSLSERMFQIIRPYIESQGISFEWNLRKWDAIKPDDTAKLIDTWFDHAKNAEEYVVCVSNFSGALIKSGLYDQFQPCLEQILARLYNKKGTLLWVEPTTTDASRKLLPRIWEFLSKRLPAFIGVLSKDSARSIQYELCHPISNLKLATGTTVQRFIRV